MGLIAFNSPGGQLTQAEYENDLGNIYNEFNGNIDNTNITGAAGIVDTKLATIQTAGKILESALPSVYSTGKSFNGGISVANSGGTGLTVANGATVTNGGLTVSLGGVTVSLGGLTVTGGVSVVDTGITVTAGGIDINSGGLAVSGGITAENSGVTITSGGLVINAGNIAMPSLATVDGIDISAHDTATTGVHGAGANTLLDSRHDATTGVHGVGTSSVASQSDIDSSITVHEGVVDNIHGAGVGNNIVGARYITKVFNNLTPSSWNIVTLTSAELGTDFNGVGVMLIGTCFTASFGSSFNSIKTSGTDTIIAGQTSSSYYASAIVEANATSISLIIFPIALSATVYAMIMKI